MDDAFAKVFGIRFIPVTQLLSFLLLVISNLSCCTWKYRHHGCCDWQSWTKEWRLSKKNTISITCIPIRQSILFIFQWLTELELSESRVSGRHFLDMLGHRAFTIQGLTLLDKLLHLFLILGNFSSVFRPTPETHYGFTLIPLNWRYLFFVILTAAVLIGVKETTESTKESSDTKRDTKIATNTNRVHALYYISITVSWCLAHAQW